MKYKVFALLTALCMIFAQPSVCALAADHAGGSVSAQVVRGSGHGQIELSVTAAAAGNTVYLVANPDDGYLAQISADRPVALCYCGLDTYSFTMPDGNVELQVSFVRAEGTDRTIGSEQSGGGSIHVSRTEARPGEAIVIEAYPGSGRLLTAMNISDSSGRAVEHLYLGRFEDAEVYEVTMPDSALYIRAEFSRRDSDAHAVSVTVQTGLGGIVETGRDRAWPGEPVLLTCYPEKGYRVAQVTGTAAITDQGNNTFTFTMPDGDAEVRVLFLRHENPFLDINETQYFYDSVLWAAGEGVTTGIDGIRFDPFAGTNRAAVVTMLWRYAGSPEPTAPCPFADVPADSWYAKAVCWAAEAGITRGISATEFGPFQVCTRAQVVTFLYRSQGSGPVDGDNPFTDVPAGCWYADAVVWALQRGVTTGVDSQTFDPNGICQRCQFVTFLHRAAGK